MRRRSKPESMTRRIVKGAIAGVAATWVMGKVTTALYDRQSARVRWRENIARRGESAPQIAARKAAALSGRRLTRNQKNKAANVVHWGVGALAGVEHAFTRQHIPGPGLMRGVMFGTLFWLLVDELLNPLFGITRGSTRFPVADPCARSCWPCRVRSCGGRRAQSSRPNPLMRSRREAEHQERIV